LSFFFFLHFFLPSLPSFCLSSVAFLLFFFSFLCFSLCVCFVSPLAGEGVDPDS